MNLSPSIPFAEQLRRKRKRTSSNSSSEPVTQPVLDVDDEIARLERELEIIDSDSDSDSGYSSSSSSASQSILTLSKFADDTIAPLPSSSLPSKKVSKSQQKKQKKATAQNVQHGGTGLQNAVKDILAGYQTRSDASSIPFYCRICSHSSPDLEAFSKHKTGALHVEAVKATQKASFCKVCRKQFTSVPQLQEHLRGRGH